MRKDTTNQSSPPRWWRVLDSRFHVSPPEGGMVVRVFAKVLDGYQPTENCGTHLSNVTFAQLMVTADEHAALVTGKFPGKPAAANRKISSVE
ncbi:MAG: hypothetical protein R3C28_12830 [Pirellulaceae bacterium]